MATRGKPSSIPTTIVECPICNAGAHQNCIMKGGKRTAISHAARVKAYKAAIKGKQNG